MRLSSWLRAAGTSVGALFIASIANAAVFSGADITANPWPRLWAGATVSLPGDSRGEAENAWQMLSSPSRAGANLESEAPSWVAEPAGTTGGMRPELSGWVAVRSGTSGLHLPLDIARTEVSPVPLPASFWLFVSGVLSLLPALRRSWRAAGAR